MAANKLVFPYEIELLDFQLNEDLLKYFLGEGTAFVQVGPEKYCFPSKYKTEAENIYNFQARPNDIWILTFPRSGTTFTQELVWLLCNNLDFDRAKNQFLSERFPFFEFHLFFHDKFKKELLKENADNKENQEFIEKISQPGYKILNEIPITQQRFIKSHLPFSLLPPSVMQNKCKIIYVTRNPKDVAVSFYHLKRSFRTSNYIGDFERYWHYFEQGLIPWTPYHSHVREALNHRSCPNICFLQFEEMRCNLPNVIEKLRKFLDCPPISQPQMNRLLDHLNIKNFGKNPAVNGSELDKVGIINKNESGFVRNGHVGGIQKEYFQTERLNERADEWLKTNEIKL